MEQGPTEKSIIEQCIRTRSPLPNAIANAPQLLPGLELYYNAFMDLTSCRQMGFGEGPISWLSVAEYCAVHSIEGDQREELFYHIREMDTAYLELRAKQSKRGSTTTPAKHTPFRGKVGKK
jgi:hypothetical protein